MRLAEDDLRTAFRDVADATPIPDRWDAIVSGSARARRQRRRVIAYSGGGLAIAAAVVAVVALAIGATTPKFAVRTGAAHHDALTEFPGGPTVAIGKLSHGRLAFVSDSLVYVVDADAGTARQLTTAGDASAFVWSADGEWLAFSVRDAPGYEDYTTWIARADGSGAQRLDGMSDTYRWSPSGHRLAIGGSCCTDSKRGGVYVVDPGHGDPRPVVAPGTQIPTIAWAPDGRTLGYTSAPIDGEELDPSVWTVGVDGGQPTRIIDGQLVMWSPGGESLLVAGSENVELVGRDGVNPRRLTGTANIGGHYPTTWAAFSPNGDHVAVVGNGGGSLVLCRTDGTQCSNIAPANPPPVSGLSFSPDGAQIAFVSEGTLFAVKVPSSLSEGVAPRVLDHLGRDLLQGAGDGVHITRGTALNAPVWLSDGTILYHHGPQLRVIDPATGRSQTVADPLGFSDAGAKDQGLPGGQPLAVWHLTTK